MPIANYGVFKGRSISRRLATGSSPHYQIHLVDDGGTHFRAAINVLSQVAPSEVLFYVKSFFIHPVTAIVKPLSSGFHPLASQPNSGALDFIRGNLFPPERMTPLPVGAPGPDNDLNEKLDQVVQRAMSDEDALVYAFGQRWGPEEKADNYFGFKPGNGIHDLHMNQGNVGRFQNDDGVWQDGGLLFEFPNQNQWTAVFLKFQSQAWHTDDRTGHAIHDPDPEKPIPDGLIGCIPILQRPLNNQASCSRHQGWMAWSHRPLLRATRRLMTFFAPGVLQCCPLRFMRACNTVRCAASMGPLPIIRPRARYWS